MFDQTRSNTNVYQQLFLSEMTVGPLETTFRETGMRALSERLTKFKIVDHRDLVALPNYPEPNAGVWSSCGPLPRGTP